MAFAPFFLCLTAFEFSLPVSPVCASFLFVLPAHGAYKSAHVVFCPIRQALCMSLNTELRINWVGIGCEQSEIRFEI